MIKACVIGLSKIGIIHCNSIKKFKKTNLSFVFDKNKKLREKYSKKYNCNTAKNFEQILKKKDIKLFIIASPTKTHEYFIKQLIKYKKMIYCEKPILMNVKKLNSLVKEIKLKKIKFCVGLNRRFSTPYMKMKKKIKGKKIDIIHITSRTAKPNVDQSVRNGGLFMDKGFHFFDLACWFGSSTPKKLITIADPISTEDFLKKKDYSDAIVNMKLKNKVIVELRFGRRCRIGQEEKIEIFGKNLKINSDYYFNKKDLYKDWNILHKNTYYKCLKNFVNSGKEYLLNEGILVQKICDMALKSAKK